MLSAALLSPAAVLPVSPVAKRLGSADLTAALPVSDLVAATIPLSRRIPSRRATFRSNACDLSVIWN